MNFVNLFLWNLTDTISIKKIEHLKIKVIKLVIRSSLNWSWACSWSSWTNIIWFYCSSRWTFKSSSIWPESGLKRRSHGSKKQILLSSTIVEIRTRSSPFWSSSFLLDFQQKILEQKFVEMEWSAGPIGSRANT